ncbi:MAG: hydantoinase B/oxoprolinase family protein [Halobacteriota archaeon]
MSSADESSRIIEDRDIDPVTLQVVGGEFDTIAQEMGYKLIRSSYSSIIRESEDIGAGILTADGQQIAEGDFTPMHVGTNIASVEGMYESFEERGLDPDEHINEGDVFIHNHPHYGATHSPDIAVMTPIFYDGEHIAWTATNAHHIDIGAATPGLAVDLEDMFAEGSLFKGTKIIDEGERVEEIWNFLETNVRTPRIVLGDLQAQISSCDTGKQRFLELIEEYGLDTVQTAADDLMAYAEALMRNEIKTIPDGEYHETGYLDDDGRNRDTRLKVDVRVTVEGSDMYVDLSDSNDQVPTGYNIPFRGSTEVAIFFIVRSMLIDTYIHDEYIPQNSGTFEPIHVEAREGCIFNPKPPASAFARINQVDFMADLLMKALSESIPERVTAGSGPHCYFISYAGTDENEEYWVYIEVNESAYGGRAEEDGLDAVDALVHNTKNRPVEDIELSHPMRIEHYRLREDGHGAGRHRGGHGIEREMTFLSPTTITCEGDGNKYGSWGFQGGKGGTPGSLQHIKADGEVIDLPSKVSGYKFETGDRFSIQTINGGGYGDPSERPVEKVHEDYLDGLITEEIARDDYRVVIENGEVDERATADLRSD